MENEHLREADVDLAAATSGPSARAGSLIRRLPGWVIMAVYLVGLGAIAWFGWWVLHSAHQASDAIAQDTTVGFRAFPVDQRTPAPRLAGTSIAGRPLDTGNFAGHVLVINVWGSWCGPCRAEAPALARVSKATYAGGARFFGVDVRDNPAAARGFEREYGITYPSFDDRSGEVIMQFNGLVPISAVPSTVFVDAHGRIAARVIGRVDETTLREETESLLQESHR